MLTHEAIEVHLSYLRPAVEALGQKLDLANKDRAAGDAVLAEKIDQTRKELTERISNIQESLGGLKWFISSIALILSGLSIAHSLSWI